MYFLFQTLKCQTMNMDENYTFLFVSAAGREENKRKR